MRHEVKYNGYTATPSDYDCLEGELACAKNIIYEKNALRPLASPSVEESFGRSCSGVWIHQTSAYKHYIYANGSNELYWYDKETEKKTRITSIGSGSNIINHIEPIGNTLAVLSNESLYYLLWDARTQSYIDLGESIPECPLSFGLQRLDTMTTDLFTVSSDVESATSTLLAETNKLIAESVVNTGRFVFPFFVRYAYRLYDGTTLSHHSSPILMLPTTTESVFACGNSLTKAQLQCIPHLLDYQAFISDDERERLLKWKDVVKSVDIFISSPIYTYDQNGKAEKTQAINGVYQYATDTVSISSKFGEGVYSKVSFSNTLSYWRLPTRRIVDIEDDIRSCNQFYFLTSIPIEQIATDYRELIDIPNDYLQALNTREVMTDDYMSHDSLIAKYAQAYNGRLNIANVTRRLYDGYDPISMVCYRNSGAKAKVQLQTCIYVEKGKATLNARTTTELTSQWDTFPYLYHPNADAYGILIQRSDASPIQGCVLTPHHFLNGAVYFDGFPKPDSDFSSNGSNIQVGRAEAVKVEDNMLYSSNVNMPFCFPLSGIKPISTGSVLGIRSASKPLSSGQFGQFPLYAFTTEGVWALSVANDGSFTPAQPITQDVCVNGASITQLDSSVVFTTERGLMLLSGAECICLTDILDGEGFDSNIYTSSEGYEISPFTEFLKNSGVIYDYTHQRIYLFNGLYDYSYVYSLESKQWGVFDVTTKIFRPIKSYTEALALDINGYVINFSTPDVADDNMRFNSFISRPIKCEDGDMFKTIETIILRGNFRKESIRGVILYGSNNLYNWHVVSSSKTPAIRGWRGSPYKYFRVCVLSRLLKDESISGCSIEFIPRLTNKLR